MSLTGTTELLSASFRTLVVSFRLTLKPASSSGKRERNFDEIIYDGRVKSEADLKPI